VLVFADAEVTPAEEAIAMAAHVVARLQSTVDEIREQSPGDLAEVFGRWVELPEVKRRGKRKTRQRVYSFARTFWLFLWHVLSKTDSCKAAVSAMLLWLSRTDGRMASLSTSAYCQARRRLARGFLDQLCLNVAHELEAQATDPRLLWLGRHVRVFDGSTTQLADTHANQRSYPQPAGQKSGCGFPTMRLMVAFSLSTGTLLAYARSSLKIGEHSLFQQLWPALAPGEVVLADCGLCSYAEIWMLSQQGNDCVMGANAARTKNIEYIERLGPDDWIVEWISNDYRPQWMDDETWARMPQRLRLRQITYKVRVPCFRTRQVVVVTTLMDPKCYPKSAFMELYRRRWHAELFLRDIKTTMGMEELRCLTPAMVHRELSMHLLAYNLVRALMFEAARLYPIDPTRLSFKQTIDFVRTWSPTIARTEDDEERQRLTDYLLYYVGQSIVPYRPNRTEPRAVKRRPKNYQRLTKPRHQFQEIPHRNKYKKCLS
jgi:hypothetical protein